MIGFHKYLVSSYSRRLDGLKTFNIKRRSINVNAADGSFSLFDAIGLTDDLGDEFRAVARMFAKDFYQPFMPQRLQGANFLLQTRRRQGIADDFLVGTAQTAVFAVVDTLVADIQRCKQNNAIAIDLFL